MWKLAIIFILGAVLRQAQAARRVNAAHVAREFMAKRSADEGKPELSQVLQLTPREGLESERSLTTARGHIKTRYHETYMGVRVYDTVVTADEEDDHDVEGTLLMDLKDDLPDVDPKISEEEAIAGAKSHLGDDEKGLSFGNEEANLYVYHGEEDREAKLVYEVSYFGESDTVATRPYAIVDAKTGDVLDSWEGLDTHGMNGVGGNLKTGKYTYGVDYDAMNTTSSDGVDCVLENANVKVIHMNHKTSGVTASHKVKCNTGAQDEVNGGYSAAHDALYFGGVVFDLYKNWYGTRPLTMGLTLRVHYSRNYENAFWDGSRMTFGDGRNRFYPLVSLDVTAHEVSHGFTQQNSNLVYRRQSGGMNEAFSDMAGEAAKFYMKGTNDFRVGFDIFKSSTGALRYMDDPTKDGKSIGHFSNYHDNMDVHYSSGVYNRAFYQLCQRPGWDTRKAFEVFVIANQMYWHANCKMEECACGVKKAAIDKGYNTADVAAAFAVVGLNVCGSNPTTAPPGPTTGPSSDQLESGKPKTGLSGQPGQVRHYYYNLSSYEPNVTFTLSGGSGDADMYIRKGMKPTDLEYDYRPFKPDSNEQVVVDHAYAGRYYVMIRGYTQYSGVSLLVTDSTAPSCGTPNLCNGAVLQGLSAARYKWIEGQYIEIPSGTSNLKFEMSGGIGDADLYIKYGAKPTTTSYDHRPYKTGNTETVNIVSPQAGRHYIGIRAYKAFSGVTLKVNY